MLDAVWVCSKTRMKDSEIHHLMEHVSVREVIEGVSGPAPLARPPDTDMLRLLKREILAARPKDVLDEELSRGPSSMVRQLADLQLPPVNVARGVPAEARRPTSQATE